MKKALTLFLKLAPNILLCTAISYSTIVIK